MLSSGSKVGVSLFWRPKCLQIRPFQVPNAIYTWMFCAKDSRLGVCSTSTLQSNYKVQTCIHLHTACVLLACMETPKPPQHGWTRLYTRLRNLPTAKGMSTCGNSLWGARFLEASVFDADTRAQNQVCGGAGVEFHAVAFKAEAVARKRSDITTCCVFGTSTFP